ncbi:type II secretion system protein [Desulfuromonas acetoxidans]|uniref:PulJ/GspJ family protein n=1 Tax=Desulfuromonas acetoxidans TaxID=891 RepID=UPI00292CE385|nr:type II secretion system protein [Desulfuromonas acetoxidans]
MTDRTLTAQSFSGRYSQAGFTLVELVVTIVIIGILVSLGGMFISQPIQGYIDLDRRTQLVGQADQALRRMQRDLRAALPNSVRVFNGGNGIEFLHVVDGGRYRVTSDPAETDLTLVANSILRFDVADDYFEVLGPLDTTEYTAANCLCAIYNLTADSGTNLCNAYAATNTAAIQAVETSGTRRFIRLATATFFPLSSPQQRFFVIDQAVSYVITGGQLRRYAGYTINQVPGPATGDNYDLVTTDLVTVVDAGGTPVDPFTYDPGTPSHSGLVTLRLALEQEGERITLMHQVHVNNAP